MVWDFCLRVSDFLYWVWGVQRFRRPFKPCKGSSESLTLSMQAIIIQNL
ncbi:hypothetical protein NEISICOT_01561 [Neisseria sicca ATCC 29256]|uniref:Uncharacterized protein n=1 Tax=Neisseria sicca ATCC 29256 TaxID=547045 RepID=C6M4W2_NEISI|nr:hypothetical protein NEISICOT_01561 [Neisseria sicca ATCC 29256]